MNSSSVIKRPRKPADCCYQAEEGRGEPQRPIGSLTHPLIVGPSPAHLRVSCGMAEVGIRPCNLLSTFMLPILSKHSVYRRTANAKGLGDRAGRFTAGVGLR
jgi:hypothetical protein